MAKGISCGTLKAELDSRDMSVLQLSFKAGISSSSLYSAVNGIIPFWPGWRSRVAKALEMSEEELFPEFKDGNEGE